MDEVEPSKSSVAQSYRMRGWRVIQLHQVGPDGLTCSCRKGRNCASKGKHPIDDEWQNTPPLSAADIEALWERRPRSNVGIATGAPSGFWVLDIDPKHGGDKAWAELKAKHGNVEPTYAVQTGSGGWHLYFAMPDHPVTNRQGIAQGIDVRGTGGQVVAPPSVTDMGTYTAYDRELAPAPAWLLELVRPTEPTGPMVTADDFDRGFYESLPPAEQQRLTTYAQKAVQANIDRLAKLKLTGWEGEAWNHTTFEVSCALLEIANSPWNTYTRAHAAADVNNHAPRDNEGFDDATVQKCFNSALGRIGNKARAMPEGRAAEEEDDLFSSPDVRGRPDPTPGAGEPTSPGVGEGYNPEVFFGTRGELDTHLLAQAVMADEPLAWGADNAFWNYGDGVWSPAPHVVEAKCVDLLRGKFRNAHVANTSTVVRHRVQHLSSDPLSRWINFRNGMLDWAAGEMHDHDPSYGSTVQIGTDWDPEATCPKFDAFLATILHEDYVKIAWEMIGYLLYSGNPLQIAFLFYGDGGNGKGTLIRVIQELLGARNVSSVSLDKLNASNFAGAEMYGKIANIAGDIDGTYQESTANFKKITGEDIYYAERKFGQPFQFTSWAVPLFSANKIPGSADVTDGYLRRWVVLHFETKITNPTPGLSDQLLGEMPGIAYKAVTALRTLMQRQKFEVAGHALEGRRLFMESIDQVRQWVREGTIAAPNRFEPRDALYDAYRIWADRNGHGRLKATEFFHRLDSIGLKSKVEGGMHGYVGMTVPGLNQPARTTTPAAFFDEETH